MNRPPPAVELERNADSIACLERRALHRRSLGEHVAHRVTDAPSILIHLLAFAAWIAVNTSLLLGFRPFDPFPFVFLTFIVSLEAIVLTLLVLMSQNRLLKEGDKRAHLDLQIDMLAEQESTMTLRLVRRMCKHLGMEDKDHKTAERLEKATDVRKLAKTLEKNCRVDLVLRDIVLRDQAGAP